MTKPFYISALYWAHNNATAMNSASISKGYLIGRKNKSFRGMNNFLKGGGDPTLQRGQKYMNKISVIIVRKENQGNFAHHFHSFLHRLSAEKVPYKNGGINFPFHLSLASEVNF